MRRQSGMSFTSVAVLIVVILLVVKTAITLIPMFWDNRMLTTVLNSMQQSREVNSETSVKQFKTLLEKRLDMNGLRLSYDDMEIRKTSQGLMLNWSYEARRNWLGNIDMVARFHQQKDFTK